MAGMGILFTKPVQLRRRRPCAIRKSGEGRNTPKRPERPRERAPSVTAHTDAVTENATLLPAVTVWLRLFGAIENVMGEDLRLFDYSLDDDPAQACKSDAHRQNSFKEINDSGSFAMGS